jgi:hypothetical protein
VPKTKTTQTEPECIEPAKLKTGTLIRLETNAAVYELVVLKDGRATVSGSRRKRQNTPCTIIGSVKTGPIIAGKILKDYHLILSLPKQRFTTGLIKSACVTNGKYTYELWKDK